ncbi:MAG: FG-GAP-like repeat-containing protein [Acidimicrobiia bacterium]|nr:FG-GAP-like repeat-containing protein [Acidimicrobiia bacterium]
MRATGKGAATVALAGLALTASCSFGGSEGTSTSTSAASPSTADAAVSTSTTTPVPDGPYLPEPGRPAGPLPSFNESAGCGVAQGIRGPYATVAGDLSDEEAIRGPWGDFYGRDFAEIREHLVEVALPMTGDREVTVWVHDAVVPALQQVIANLEREEAAGNYYEIRSGEVHSFRPATVAPKRYLSFHAVGAAIDINSIANPYRGDNVLETDMPDWFVKAWTDAGWCWGGAWQTIKDAMHFSWQGPLYTPGYPPAVPATARTAEWPFLRGVTFATVLGPAPAGSSLFLADADRDGAPDVVRTHPWTAEGGLGVEIAQALYGFEAGCTPLLTSPIAPAAALLVADGDGDARPDLWEVDASGERVEVTIHTHASGFGQRLRPRVTGAPAAPDAVFLAGDYDRDGSSDLFVLQPGKGVLEVWAGPGFEALLTEAGLPEGVGEGWRFALGDYDGDGVPDLFALGPDDPARLLILSGAAGYAGDPARVTTGVSGHDGALAVGDLDGDGRPDLYFLDGDGSVTVYLGGYRPGVSDAGLTYWFVEGDDQPTTRQEACPVVP